MPGLFEGADVVDGPVGRVADRALRVEVPAEPGPPEQVLERDVLHHVGRGHQHAQDDAGLPAVDGVVVVVAQGWRAAIRHGRRIGVGGADAQVGQALIALDRRAVGIEPSLLEELPGLGSLGRQLGLVLRTRARSAGAVAPSPPRELVLAGRPSHQSSARRRRVTSSNSSAEVLPGLPVEPGHQAIQVGIGPHLGRVEEQLLAPDQAGRLAQLDDLLEEALEDLDAQTRPDPGQAGVVGQRLVQGVAEVPAMGQVQAGQLDQLALRADPLEEHDQLELEEDDRIDGSVARLPYRCCAPGRGRTLRSSLASRWR